MPLFPFFFWVANALKTWFTIITLASGHVNMASFKDMVLTQTEGSPTCCDKLSESLLWGYKYIPHIHLGKASVWLQREGAIKRMTSKPATEVLTEGQFRVLIWSLQIMKFDFGILPCVHQIGGLQTYTGWVYKWLISQSNTLLHYPAFNPTHPPLWYWANCLTFLSVFFFPMQLECWCLIKMFD